MKYSNKELNFIADRIEKNLYELNDWEQGFFKTVKPRIRSDIPLSSKTHECLSKIWDKLENI